MKKYDEPLWSYTLDIVTPDNLKVIYRSLFNATIELSYNKNDIFTPKDVFLYNKEMYFGESKSESVKKVILELLLHNLLQEGFVNSNTCFLEYPSHNSNNNTSNFTILDATHSLSRWRDTLNKSYLRSVRKHSKITFEEEFNSLVLKSQKQIKDKIVIVLDDFSTTGLSLEASRNLLVSAEAEKVILCSIGKFSKEQNPKHRVYKIHKPFNPYTSENKIEKGDYTHYSTNLCTHHKVKEDIQSYFLDISKK
ncbi:MAG: phosphoribosyltransferase [Cyanobacteriota bacterium]